MELYGVRLIGSPRSEFRNKIQREIEAFPQGTSAPPAGETRIQELEAQVAALKQVTNVFYQERQGIKGILRVLAQVVDPTEGLYEAVRQALLKRIDKVIELGAENAMLRRELEIARQKYRAQGRVNELISIANHPDALPELIEALANGGLPAVRQKIRERAIMISKRAQV